jgi:hypothetical protein
VGWNHWCGSHWQLSPRTIGVTGEHNYACCGGWGHVPGACLGCLACKASYAAPEQQAPSGTVAVQCAGRQQQQQQQQCFLCSVVGCSCNGCSTAEYSTTVRAAVSGADQTTLITLAAVGTFVFGLALLLAIARALCSTTSWCRTTATPVVNAVTPRVTPVTRCAAWQASWTAPNACQVCMVEVAAMRAARAARG